MMGPSHLGSVQGCVLGAAHTADSKWLLTVTDSRGCFCPAFEPALSSYSLSQIELKTTIQAQCKAGSCRAGGSPGVPSRCSFSPFLILPLPQCPYPSPYTPYKGRVGTPWHPQGAEAGTGSLAQADQQHLLLDTPVLELPPAVEPLQPFGQGTCTWESLQQPRDKETARNTRETK